MSSEVDICNVALAHLGDTATVTSINPPEGSVQAEHCARFYPMVRDSLLEMHNWSFSTRRVTLALLSSAWPEWQYCYAAPADAINLLGVLPPLASDDYSVPLNYLYAQSGYTVNPVGAIYQPQPFSWEALEDGTQVIYTDQENAMLRYTCYVTDTAVFSPLFTDTLGWYLASYLAGPVIKGEAGAAEAKRCLQIAQTLLAKATTSDANQRRTAITQNTPWMTGR